MTTEQTFEIWSECYTVTGNHGVVHFHGKAQGTHFKDACDRLAREDASFYDYYNSKSVRFYGCRLFPSKQAAQDYGKENQVS